MGSPLLRKCGKYCTHKVKQNDFFPLSLKQLSFAHSSCAINLSNNRVIQCILPLASLIFSLSLTLSSLVILDLIPRAPVTNRSASNLQVFGLSLYGSRNSRKETDQGIQLQPQNLLLHPYNTWSQKALCGIVHSTGIFYNRD